MFSNAGIFHERYNHIGSAEVILLGIKITLTMIMATSFSGGRIRSPNNSYKPITNITWVRARLCELQKGCTRLAAASDKVCQLLAHGRWFYPGTPASSTTKTGRHDHRQGYLDSK
jgi:hypothetical protein